MSKSASSGQLRPLPFLHSAAMLVLAIGWARYCWRESPLGATTTRVRPRDTIFGLHHALDIFQASLGDLLLGFSTILLFAIGTGIYVRRIQVWIDARSSGEAVAYGSAGLKEQALAANINHERQS
jgi:hypothetical protein